MDAAHDRRRHLGEILVEEGFITPDALAGALERQATTQRPLGEVVVELGLVSPGAVANALAEQHGGVLRTEYGISAGLRPAAVEADEPAAPDAAATEPAADVLDAWRAALAERDRLILELSTAVRSRDQLLEESALEIAALSEQLALAATAPPAAAHDPNPERIAELEGERAELRAELAARTTEIDRVREEAAIADAATETLTVELAQRTEELDELRLRLAEAEAPPEPVEPDVESTHVLFVPAREGYELLERDGPAPARGAIVELDVAYVVSRVGTAPLPGATRCAFLERA